MAGDWLQGPYVYALYQEYGMSKRTIEFLFVAGFGASMVVGTVVGSLADKFGRRRNCIAYGVIYSLSCVTKHFNNFWILLLGRVLGGTATSILWSGFEAWLVHEHHSRGFSDSQLKRTFAVATVGNSVVAIASGLVAQYAVDTFGFVAPFDCALLALAAMTGFVWWSWSENYGNADASVEQGFADAFGVLRSDRRVLCLGVVQALFEGSMYCFVLEWTPVLTPAAGGGAGNDGHAGKIPHGFIFSSYMVSMMIGSLVFQHCCQLSLRPESFMRWVFAASCVCLAMPVLKRSDAFIPVTFVGFLVFEFGIGLFMPGIGTMRSKYVPDSVRATIMNFFRVPLNLVVVLILTQNLPLKVIFMLCTAFLLLCFLAQCGLNRLTSSAEIETQRQQQQQQQQLTQSLKAPADAEV